LLARRRLRGHAQEVAGLGRPDDAPRVRGDGPGHRHAVVYQGARGPLAPVTLSTRIVNEKDETVSTTSETLAVDRFAAGRRMESSFELPLDRLPPGAYLLTFEATMRQGQRSTGRAVQRPVRRLSFPATQGTCNLISF